MSEGKKIVHIISDPKFISQTDKFIMTGIDNRIIFWVEKNTIPQKLRNNAIVYHSKKENIAKVIKECNDANLVVIYSLMPAIVVRIPRGIKVIWRFFGVELYEKILSKVLSNETKDIYFRTNKQRLYRAELKKKIFKIYPNLSTFYRSVQRIDYFLGVFEEEYEYLKSMGFALPQFIKSPIYLPNLKYNTYRKDPLILLGNSRTFFNNHIDIINLLEKIDVTKNIQIKVPFSYGNVPKYSCRIKKASAGLKNTEFIEEFLNQEEFEKIYENAAALIINSYRQMALGNITIAIRKGTKIYLSERNVTYYWLLKNGFKIYSIENDLTDNLKNNKFYLTPRESQHNLEKLEILVNSYTLNDFQNKIRTII